MTPRNNPISSLLSIALIILLGFAAYSNSLHGEFQFDDKDFIVNNPAIRDITDLKSIWHSKGIPLRFFTFLSFALNYHFHGFETFGYHLVNLLLHLANGVLVWWLARLILSEPALRKKGAPIPFRDLISLGAALIFTLHPVQTEAVSYITQRFASLATLFYVLSLCAFIHYRKNERPGWLMLALAAGLCATFTKQISFTLAIMIILYDLCFPVPGKKPFIKNLFFLSIAGVFLVIMPFLYRFNFAGILGRDYISRSHEGDYLYWLTYALTQLRVVCKYVQLTVLPVRLNFEYDFPASYSLFEPQTFIAFIAIVTALYAAVRLLPKRRLVSFTILWFFITLSVESTIIVIPHVIYEHRLYLPLVGVSILMSYALVSVIKNKKTVTGVLILMVLVYGALTYQRNKVWQNGLSLWSDVIKKSPQKSRPYHNRGFHYLEAGEFQKAIRDFNAAIKLNPRYVQAYSNRATAHIALGDARAALSDYQKAIELQENNAQSYHNRAHLYARLGNLPLAYADFAKAIEINPQYFLAYYSRGRTRAQNKNYDGALADFAHSITIYPDFPFHYIERGRVFLDLRQNERAVADFSKCLELDPDNVNALNNRAIAYSRQNDHPKALADINKALERQPENPAVLFNRSLIYFADKKYEKALADALKAQETGFSVDKSYLEQLKRFSRQ